MDGEWLYNARPEELEEARKVSGEISVGPPRGSDRYTAAELSAMGLVGVYRKQEEEEGS